LPTAWRSTPCIRGQTRARARGALNSGLRPHVAENAVGTHHCWPELNCISDVRAGPAGQFDEDVQTTAVHIAFNVRNALVN
jgi:hypothetical protein